MAYAVLAIEAQIFIAWLLLNSALFIAELVAAYLDKASDETDPYVN